jgi:hypothetical protein
MHFYDYIVLCLASVQNGCCDICLFSLVVIYLVICSIAGVRKEHSTSIPYFCSRYVHEARRYSLYLCCPFIVCGPVMV